MKNIFKIFSSKNLKKNIKTIGDRFPVSIIITFIVATIFFILLHFEDNLTGIGKKLIIANISLIMTFVFSIATYLSTENSSKTKLQRNLFQIIPIIFGVIFYNIFSLDINDFENFLFFFLTFSGIIAYLFFAPYLKNLKVKSSVFYTYFYNISVVILISFIFAGVLFGLGAIAIAAVDTLFNLDISEKNTYGNWAILSLSIIAPLFALTQIPNKKSFSENHFNENAFFSFLIKFVAIPFIYLYFFILYAYSIKVLANFGDWPKGEVTWLVIGFSIFGYLTYSFSYIFETPSISPPLKGETSKVNYINIFRKIFPYAVIPQVFMLFYAIYLRIAQYDLTVNRYFVVVFGLWLLVTSLHFIFSKKKNLIAIPAGLALFIIIISIIPKFNVYNYPEERQLSRLETNLKKAGIIKVTEEMYKYTIAQEIVPLKNYSDISQDLSKNIYSGIDYLCDFNSCESIKELFPKIYSEIERKDKDEWEKEKKEDLNSYEFKYEKDNYDDECLNGANDTSSLYESCVWNQYKKEILDRKYEGPGKWEIVRKITDKIKVKNNFYIDGENREYITFSKDYRQDIFPMDISGYKNIFRIQNYEKINQNKEYAQYNAEKEEIILILKKGETFEMLNINTKNISDILYKNIGKYDNLNNFDNLNTNSLYFEIDENGKYKVNGKYKLYFESITIKNPDYKINNDDNKINSPMMRGYTSGYLLVK